MFPICDIRKKIFSSCLISFEAIIIIINSSLESAFPKYQCAVQNIKVHTKLHEINIIKIHRYKNGKPMACTQHQLLVLSASPQNKQII